MVILNYALVCERFTPGELGKYSFVDVFDKVVALKGVPAARLQTTVVAAISGSTGKYKEKLEIVELSTGKTIAEVQADVEIKNNSRNVLAANFVGLAFPSYGKYWLKVTIDGVKEALSSPDIHYVEVVKSI